MGAKQSTGKVLADIATHEGEAFSAIIAQAKHALRKVEGKALEGKPAKAA